MGIHFSRLTFYAMLLPAAWNTAALAAPGLQQTLAAGGAQSTAGAVRMVGTITDFGPPAGALTGSADRRVAVGFLPALAELIKTVNNAADDIWLELNARLGDSVRRSRKPMPEAAHDPPIKP
jgi:hypothetical protein